MKNIILAILVIGSLVGFSRLWAYADTTPSGKCYTNCVNAERPDFDQYGNEFDYLGNLINASCGTNNPANPECNCTAPSVVVGHDPKTNAVICGNAPAPVSQPPQNIDTPVVVPANFSGK